MRRVAKCVRACVLASLFAGWWSCLLLLQFSPPALTILQTSLPAAALEGAASSALSLSFKKKTSNKEHRHNAFLPSIKETSKWVRHELNERRIPLRQREPLNQHSQQDISKSKNEAKINRRKCTSETGEDEGATGEKRTEEADQGQVQRGMEGRYQVGSAHRSSVNRTGKKAGKIETWATGGNGQDLSEYRENKITPQRRRDCHCRCGSEGTLCEHSR